MSKKVLSLGQCAADNYTIGRFLEETFGADVVPVDSFAQALGELRKAPFDIVLVNRILDVGGASGLAFIGQVKSDATLAKVPVMLVSNFPEAQEQAVAAGALPGFGKATLRDPHTIERLKKVLGNG